MRKAWITWCVLSAILVISACDSSSGGGSEEPVELPSELISYSPAVNLSNSEYLTVDGNFTIDTVGTIHAFWFEDAEVYYSRSFNSGATFDLPRVVVSRAVGRSYFYLDSANTPNAIHLAWTEFNQITGSAEIFHMRSTDGGDSFEPSKLVSLDDGFDSYASSISADPSGRVAIGWTNETSIPDRPKYSLSMDEGVSFGVPSFLPSASGGSPGLLLAPPMFYASWAEIEALFDLDIVLASSADSGSSYDQTLNISQNATRSWNMGMATGDAGEVYALWVEGSAISGVVRLAISFDYGQTFSSPVSLSDTSENSPCSSIATDSGGRLYIVWSTREGSPHLYRSYMVVSNDRGTTFSPALRMPLISTSNGCPQILSNSLGGLAMLWRDTGVGAAQREDVFYSNLSVDWP